MQHTKIYDPPIDEFSVLHTTLDGGKGEEESQKGVEGPSVLIVTAGSGELRCEGVEGELEEGSVWFVSAGKEVSLKASGKGELSVYRAFVEVPEGKGQ